MRALLPLTFLVITVVSAVFGWGVDINYKAASQVICVISGFLTFFLFLMLFKNADPVASYQENFDASEEEEEDDAVNEWIARHDEELQSIKEAVLKLKNELLDENKQLIELNKELNKRIADVINLAAEDQRVHEKKVAQLNAEISSLADTNKFLHKRLEELVPQEAIRLEV